MSVDDGDLTIHQAIAEIINELGGIGKTSKNIEQHYNYRGIDAVLTQLHPLFAKYGVFFAPTILERIYEERISKSGTTGHCCHLHVRFNVYGPTGDTIMLDTWGEGLDYSDKATNKAMTAAFKYALFQLFAICDPAEDADRSGGEGGLTGDSIPVMQSLSDRTPLQYLADALVGSGFTLAVQSDIIAAAIGRVIRNLGELTEGEVSQAIVAIESAIADRDQLQQENS